MLRVTRRKSCVNILSILNDVARQKSNLTFTGMLKRPQVPLQSLPFVPPPRWASELNRELRRRFDELFTQGAKDDQNKDIHFYDMHHHMRYVQAFIHPTFTTSDGVNATMQSLAPLGEAVIVQDVTTCVSSTFDHLTHADTCGLLALLCSDAALGRVLRDEWRLEQLVLTDAAADVFSRDKTRSSKGLVRWLADNKSQSLPDPYSSDCVKALVGAVLLEHGYDASIAFCRKHVTPVVTLDA